ncbi:YhdP family protein [Comamonas serinivorans]|nr:YhdP family protein [Comamonas serinivorans]
MSAAISPPYVRWLARLLRWSLRALGVAAVVTALAWALLSVWIVPRIDQWRPEIAHWASQRLGVRVDIGAISGSSNGWHSRFTLRQVQLFKPGSEPTGASSAAQAGAAALQFRELQVAVTPWSAWQLSFDELRAVRPELEVRRDTAGQYWVGGFALPTTNPDTPSDMAWADLLLKQRHLQIQQGQVRWLDERLGGEPLQLQAVDVSLANEHRHHRLALAATPPPAWGQRFTWQADLRTPLWASADARQLSGQVFADFPSLDVAALRRHVDAGIDLQAAQGAVRVWFDLKRSLLTQATVDLDVQRVAARFAKDLSPLDLRDVAGRVVWQTQAEGEGFVLRGEQLRFATADGQRWSDARVRLATQRSDGSVGELQAQQVNLAALRQVLNAVPLDAQVRDALHDHPVSGRVQNLQARWHREGGQPLAYSAQGSVRALAVPALPPAVEHHAGVPGLRGADVDFDLSERGGSAQLRMQGGMASFPGVFVEPDIPLDALAADVSWTLAGDDIALEVKDLTLRNADAQGRFTARWRTKPSASLAPGESRFPGELDLSGELSQANGARVYRYLPSAVGEHALRYVKEAVVAGQARKVQATVRGDLAHFPFPGSKQGLFRIVAPVDQVVLNYVPRYLQHAQEPAWPVLEHLSGHLEFEGDSMRVREASGRVRGFPSIRFARIEAGIAQLEHPDVRVQAKGESSAGEGLAFVQQSPVAQWLHGALEGMQASGTLGLGLELGLPIAHIEQATVKGEVGLRGNTLRLRDDVPLLSQAQGRVLFTEHGFSLDGAQAQALGGAVALTGGTRAQPEGTQTVIEAQGHATAAGLRGDDMLRPLAPLLAHVQGDTDYRVRYAVLNGRTEVDVSSSLLGMGLDLPAPLHKAPDARWPLHVAVTPREGDADELNVTLAELAHARYARHHTATGTEVRAGLIGLGGAAAGVAQADLPRAVGVRAELDTVDLDAWQRVLGQATAPAATAGATVPAPLPAASAPSRLVSAPAAGGSAPSTPAAGAASLAGPARTEAPKTGSDATRATGPAPLGASPYAPVAFDVQARHLQLEGKSLADLRLRGTHQGQEWALMLDSDVVAGQISYRDDGAGRLHARLSKLHVPAGSAGASEALEPEPELLRQSPSRLPGMDLVVQDLRIGDKQLGQFTFRAANQGSQSGRHVWQIERMSLAGPGGTLQASGAWQPADVRGQRHTELSFTLQVDDAGRLLGRLGMPGVLSRGQGEITGALSWAGSPLQPDPASLDGHLKVDVVKGQFLKADPGLAKLLGVLSLQSLPRRLSLDFRDVFSDGFAYDFIRGDARLARGQATTNNLQMKGVNAAVLLEGEANLVKATQNLRVVVAPRIDAGGAALVATVINPAVGIGAFLAQLVLGKQINEANTRVFQVTGTWAEPEVTRLATPAEVAAPGDARR